LLATGDQPEERSAAPTSGSPRSVATAVAGLTVLGHNAAMKWRDRIVADPRVLVGKAVIKGSRISVELVMDLLARSYTREQILDQYPQLTGDDVQACLAYAAEVLRSERMFGLPA
jgi:uncharacterized protein (DUF433 family)